MQFSSTSRDEGDPGAEDNLLKEGRKTQGATGYTSFWTVSWAFSDTHMWHNFPLNHILGWSRMQHRPRSTCSDTASAPWGPYRWLFLQLKAHIQEGKWPVHRLLDSFSASFPRDGVSIRDALEPVWLDGSLDVHELGRCHLHAPWASPQGHRLHRKNRGKQHLQRTAGLKGERREGTETTDSGMIAH